MKKLLLGLLFIVGSNLYAQDTNRNVEIKNTKPKESKTALVFVQKADSTWEPRIVQIGISDWDYTEIISGLKEGERVALLSAAILQAKRDASNAQLSQAVGGSSPLGTTSTVRPRN